jgi:hypothetical protein
MSILTEKDKKYILQIISDLESGNHLVCPRSDEYKAFWNECALAVNGTNNTPRDLELKNYYYSQIKEWQNQENFK